MRPRCAVLLTPLSPTPAFLQNVAKSCICHTSEKLPVTPIIATDPKMRSCKSCVCHTCDPLPKIRLDGLQLSLVALDGSAHQLDFRARLARSAALHDGAVAVRVRRGLPQIKLDI